MDFNDFTEELAGELRVLNEGKEVFIRRVVKMNGVTRMALNIMDEECDCSPNVYLEPVYEQYLRYDLSIRQTAMYVTELHRRMMRDVEEACRLEKDLEDFEKVRARLTLRMVNAGMNQEMLEESVYVPFLDLAAVFYIADDLHRMNAIVRVTEDMAGCWDMSAEGLMEAAMENLRKHGHFRLQDLRDVICENDPDVPEESIPKEEPYMYVLTDGSRLNGSAALMLPELLDMAAGEIGDDLILLPSSISELIVLGACGAEYEKLKEIVADVNDQVVEAEEILSYHIYKYSRDTQKVSIAA